MANEIYDSTWWGNTIDTASSIGTSTEMIQGQFNMNKLGDDLVVNGDFATDSDWLKSSGVSILNNVATTTVVSGGYQYFSQSINYQANKHYKLTIKVNGDDGFACAFYDTSGNNGGLKNSDGLVQFNGQDQIIVLDFISNNNSDRILCARSGSGDYSYSVDLISIQQVRATTVEAVKCLADAIHRIGIQDIQN